MENYAIIEQLNFQSDINTVGATNYPTVYHLHWHQHAEIVAVPKENSFAILKINQRLITLLTGDILIIWPGELHEIADNSSHAIIALQFPMSLLNNRKEFAYYFDLYRDSFLLRQSQTPELNSQIMKDFLDIMNISTNYNDHFRNTKMSIRLYEIFMKVASLTESSNVSSVSLESDYENITNKIQQACVYIKTHCEENLSLETVAAQIGFSSCYFSRHFKKITTHSFVEYLTLQRISRLQTLLADRSISITNAAYQSGFKSLSTLNRTFSKYCGCSPREYRRYFTK